jgi:hypothetical protein
MFLNVIKKIKWFLEAQFGLDLLKMFSFFIKFPTYVLDYFKIKKLYPDIKISFKPCIHDSSTLVANNFESKFSEYFYQDLFVAQKVFDFNPKNILDVGSRVDGFISNVASFREISTVDIRELGFEIKNIKSKIMDITKVPKNSLKFEMVTCLHALEHFGLGRYGDKIDKDAYKVGIEGLAKVLSDDGSLILSTPVGKEKIEFNANWIFNPIKLLKVFSEYFLSIKDIYIFDDIENKIKKITIEEFKNLKNLDYSLVILFLKKI